MRQPHVTTFIQIIEMETIDRALKVFAGENSFRDFLHTSHWSPFRFVTNKYNNLMQTTFINIQQC